MSFQFLRNNVNLLRITECNTSHKHNLLIKHYNSCRVLAFSTIFFHSRRSWASSDHLVIFIFLKSFLTSSSHLFFGLPTGRVASGCHLYIFFTTLVSGHNPPPHTIGIGGSFLRVKRPLYDANQQTPSNTAVKLHHCSPYAFMACRGTTSTATALHSRPK